MRVADNNQVLLANLRRIRTELFQRNREVASGKRLHSPSQDPAASARVTRIRDELSRINQYGRNVQRAQVLLGSADGAFNSLKNLTEAAIERTAFAVSAIANQDTRDIIADEIEGFRDSILRIADTNVDGKNIFSGTDTGTSPYQLVAGTYVYQGNDQPLQVEIARNRTIQTSIPGSEIFSEAGTDLINSLTQLADDIRAGDSTAAQAGIDNLNQANRLIDLARVKLSESIQLTEASTREHQRQLVALTQEISSLEDADLAESIIGLGRLEASLQAALLTGARQTVSLFDLIG